MRVSNLQSGWTVEPTDSVGYPRSQIKSHWPLPAEVPGAIHLDLMRAGVIPDPYQECFEHGLAWIDETDWTYRCPFSWSSADDCPRQVLRFEGVDTVCHVELNGKQLAAHDNFFCAFEVDVTGILAERNELVVRVRSAVKVGEERRRAYFAEQGLPWNLPLFDERAFVRKPAYMFGWDWGPRLVSCGIWKPVRLLEFSSRIREFSVLQRDGAFTAEIDVEGPDQVELAYNGRSVGSVWEAVGELWWPNGEGGQPLQIVEAKLPSGHAVRKRIGLRTIELVRKPDPYGTSFEFAVNGRRIWSRGANWIPNDSFPSRVSDSDYANAVDRYARLGMNMLRVWGGGLYERDAFYDACDERGILVWQDFPYACSYYPDDLSAQDNARNEAEHQVGRLRDRTSLALWCGNNENRSLHFGKWSSNPPDRFHGEALYDEVLKDVVARLDPDRPFIESSPLLVGGMGTPDPQSHSDDHYWEVWHGKGDWANYKDSTTRFSSEFGFASSCSMACWSSVSRRALDVLDPAVRSHDKTNKPWDTFRGLVELHYGPSETLEEWVYKSQMNQRDAMRAAIEHYRGGERCRGALIWQANDCWPVQSWSLEDYRRLLKPAGFELRRLYAPVLLIPQLFGQELRVTIANDGPTDFEGAIEWGCCGFDGQAMSAASVATSAPSGERTTLSVALKSQPPAVWVRIENQPGTERWLFASEPKDVNLPAAPLRCRREGSIVTIEPTGLCLDLCVWNDGDPAALRDLETGLAGFRAHSGIEAIQFQAHGELSGLRARSISGTHVLTSEVQSAP